MVFPGAYSRSKSYFWSFMKKRLIRGRHWVIGFVKDGFKRLMTIDDGKMTSVKVLMKPLDSKDN